MFWADVKSCFCLPMGASGVIESKEGFEEHHQLVLARVVAVPTQSQVPLQVANLFSSAVTLYMVQMLLNYTLLP